MWLGSLLSTRSSRRTKGHFMSNKLIATIVSALALVFASGHGPAGADGVFGKISNSAKKAGESIGNGINSVGNSVEKGVNYVGDSVGSAVDLASNEDTPEQTRAEIDAMAIEVKTRLLAENASAREAYAISEGYAVFDSRNITLFPVSAGFGRGVAVNKTTGSRIYMNMGAGGVGAAFGVGGFATQFVIMFSTEGDFLSFVNNGYDATAEGGTMVGDDTAQEVARFVDGRAFFALGKKGWRVNASATGTKYWKSPELN